MLRISVTSASVRNRGDMDGSLACPERATGGSAQASPRSGPRPGMMGGPPLLHRAGRRMDTLVSSPVASTVNAASPAAPRRRARRPGWRDPAAGRRADDRRRGGPRVVGGVRRRGEHPGLGRARGAHTRGRARRRSGRRRPRPAGGERGRALPVRAASPCPTTPSRSARSGPASWCRAPPSRGRPTSTCARSRSRSPTRRRPAWTRAPRSTSGSPRRPRRTPRRSRGCSPSGSPSSRSAGRPARWPSAARPSCTSWCRPTALPDVLGALAGPAAVHAVLVPGTAAAP